MMPSVSTKMSVVVSFGLRLAWRKNRPPKPKTSSAMTPAAVRMFHARDLIENLPPATRSAASPHTSRDGGLLSTFRARPEVPLERVQAGEKGRDMVPPPQGPDEGK